MKLDQGRMARIHGDNLASAVRSAHGEVGMDGMRLLLEALPRIHDVLPVDTLAEGLVVYVLAPGVEVPDVFGEATPALDVLHVASADRGFTILISGRYFHYHPSIVSIPDDNWLVGYRISVTTGEQWLVQDKKIPVFNPVPDYPSAFAAPFFTQLEAALEHYAAELVARSRCWVLKQAWTTPERIFWVQRPEEYIRRSLEQYLAGTLGDAVVEVEHVVDEVKEVDIIVNWRSSRRAALIECKWMGVSFSEVRDDGTRARTVFSQQAARKGMLQLADYLDRHRERAAGRSFVGHLVVIDGRRGRVGHPDSPPSERDQADLFKYQHRRVKWPSELVQRSDMGKAFRMFCAPDYRPVVDV